MSERITFNCKVEAIYNSNMQRKSIRVSSYTKFEGGVVPKSLANKSFIKPVYHAYVYGEDLPLIEGLNVKLVCKVTRSKDKIFLNCESWTYTKPENLSAIRSFLFATLGKEKLLSSYKIDSLLKKYGSIVVDIFKAGNTNALFPIFCSKGSLTENVERMEKAIRTIKERYENDDFVAKMSELGFNPVLTHKIIDQAGITSIEELKDNPYACMKVSGVGFKTCDQIAVALDAALDSPERIVACTEATMSAISKNTQDLYFDSNSVMQETLKQLNNKNITVAMWSKAVMNNFKGDQPKFFIRNTGNKTTMMLKSDADNELIASRKIRALQSDCGSTFSRELVSKIANKINDDGEATRGYRFTDEQVNAMVNALSNKVSIITGGPGTGKTTITQVVIQIWKSLSNLPITCMAPTGKAATRMKEQTGEAAQTIHKTVKIIPGEETTDLERLKKGLIIIDESSMIDQETLTKMICCIPNGSTVIFLGDINQLPSVGKGDVLHQLIVSGAIATSRLTATKRQAAGSPIIDNAQKIINDDYNLVYDNKEFKFVQGVDNDVEKFKQLYLSKIKQYGVEQVAVLCPLRQPTKHEFRMTSDSLNIYIREALNPKTDKTVCLEAKHGSGKLEFRVGDRVMSWANKDDVANGDIGKIVGINEDEYHEWTVDIDWETGVTSHYSRDDMSKVSLAYSMSIHKSQGSEYKCVIMPIMSQHKCKIHNKNLIYTGITRAKKECIIFGDKKAVKDTILTNNSSTRHSYLGERLAASK